MKRLSLPWYCLLMVAVSAAWSPEADAASSWRFSRVAGLKAVAAAANDTTIYALDENDFLAGSGYRIRINDYGINQWRKKSSSDGRGTSLAVDAFNHHVYTVALDNRVWRRQEGQTSWWAFPRTQCEGGNLTPRQEVGYNNVSASQGHAYVIGGTRVRYWNGSCWYKLPPMPEGSPTEIAQAGQNPNHVWALNANGEIYHWDGAWHSMAPGIGEGLGYGLVIGSDGVSLWRWSSSAGFTYDSSWTDGSIYQIQRSDGSSGHTVVRPNGELWWYGYHQN